MIDLLGTLFGVYADVSILNIYLNRFERKISRDKWLILILLYGFVNVVFNMFYLHFLIKIIMNIVMIMGIMQLGCRIETFTNTLKNTAFFLIFLGIGELLVIPIVILYKGVYDIDLFYDLSIPPVWIVTLMISRMITLAFLQLFKKSSLFGEYGKSGYERIIEYLPLGISFAVLITVQHFLIYIEEFEKQDIALIFILISLLLVAFTIIHIKFFESLMVAQRQEKEILNLQHCDETQFVFNEEKSRQEEEIQKIHHDLKNHLIVLKEKWKISDTEYINSLLASVSQENCVKSGCNVFDVLIYYKTKDARQKGIKVNLIVAKNIAAINFIPERDLCSLFGNLLDNSIEHSAETDNNKDVFVHVDIVNNFFVLMVRNSYNHTVRYAAGGVFLSTKADSANHGIGLQSVKSTVEKYDGCYSFDYDNINFTAQIMIPLKNNGAEYAV